MTDIITHDPRTLEAMEAQFSPETPEEHLQEQFRSLSSESISLSDRLSTAFDLLDLGTGGPEYVKGYYPSRYYSAPERQTVGELEDVHIGLFMSKEFYHLNVMTGTGRSDTTKGTFRINRNTGELDKFVQGGLGPDRAMQIVSAGLSDMVHDTLGIPRPEIVAEEEPTPIAVEAQEEDPFSNGYEAAQYLIDDLLHDTRERYVHGIGAGMLFRRQGVINIEATGRQYTIDKYTDAQGDYAFGTTYVTMKTEGGTVQFQLGPEGVMQVGKGKKWRDRDEGITTIDDVFYRFAEDLIELDALRDDPERYKKL